MIWERIEESYKRIKNLYSNRGNSIIINKFSMIYFFFMKIRWNLFEGWEGGICKVDLGKYFVK